jgi:predicted DNA-binding transcriptional regulator AlpA
MSAQTIPPLAGLDEASEILGWSKQHIHSYISRGVFPQPIQRLASGPIWTREQIEQYKKEREKREG